MAYIGRQQSSGAFTKLDDISSQFDNSTTTFNLEVGGEAFFPINAYTLLVSLGGVIQEAITSFTIVENQINFAAAPVSGANFFFCSPCNYKCNSFNIINDRHKINCPLNGFTRKVDGSHRS